MRELRDLNKELNGKGEDPLAGIKALATALTVGNAPKSEGEQPKDMSTDEFDY